MLCDAFMQALQALRKLCDDDFVGEEARLCLDLPSMLRVAAPTCVWGSIVAGTLSGIVHAGAGSTGEATHR